MAQNQPSVSGFGQEDVEDISNEDVESLEQIWEHPDRRPNPVDQFRSGAHAATVILHEARKKGEFDSVKSWLRDIARRDNMDELIDQINSKGGLRAHADAHVGKIELEKRYSLRDHLQKERLRVLDDKLKVSESIKQDALRRLEIAKAANAAAGKIVVDPKISLAIRAGQLASRRVRYERFMETRDGKKQRADMLRLAARVSARSAGRDVVTEADKQRAKQIVARISATYTTNRNVFEQSIIKARLEWSAAEGRKAPRIADVLPKHSQVLKNHMSAARMRTFANKHAIKIEGQLREAHGTAEIVKCDRRLALVRDADGHYRAASVADFGGAARPGMQMKIEGGRTVVEGVQPAAGKDKGLSK